MTTGVFLTLLVGEVCPGAAQIPANDLKPGLPGTAFVLFISGDTPAMLPMTVGQLRLAGTGLLSRELVAAGQHPISPADLAPLLTRWRVRSTWSIPRGLLADIKTELGAERLFVAHLIARPGHLAMVGRYLATETGQLLSVEIAENQMEVVGNHRPEVPGPDWQVSLRNCCHTIASQKQPAVKSELPNLLVLPALATGCDDQFAAMATYSLLQAILSDPRWHVVDPSLPVHDLQEAGFYPELLDRYGFAMLQKQFRLSNVLLPQLIAFDGPTLASSFAVSAPGRWGYRSSVLDAFNLVVLQIDFEKRAISNASNCYNESNQSAGWFGVMSDDSALQRLQTSAHELWAELSKNLEDS